MTEETHKDLILGLWQVRYMMRDQAKKHENDVSYAACFSKGAEICEQAAEAILLTQRIPETVEQPDYEDEISPAQIKAIERLAALSERIGSRAGLNEVHTLASSVVQAIRSSQRRSS